MTGIVCICFEQESNPHILAKAYVAWGPSCRVIVKIFPSKLKLRCLDVLFKTVRGYVS